MVNLPELIKDIQQFAGDSARCDIVTLLQKCKQVAKELQNEEFVGWAKCEIEGYPVGANVPEYRIFPVHLKGRFSALGNRQMCYIPNHLIPEMLRKELLSFKLRESIAVVQGWAQVQPGNSVALQFSDWASKFKNVFKMVEKRPAGFGGEIEHGMECHELYGEFSEGVPTRILGVVRSKALDFSYDALREVEPKNGARGADSFLRKEQDPKMVQTNVHGDQNIVVVGGNNSVSVSRVIKGDFNSLRECFIQTGLSPEDTDALHKALKVEPKATGGEFGPKVQEWMSQMINKAKDGVWDIAIKAGKELLQRALSQYYGM